MQKQESLSKKEKKRNRSKTKPSPTEEPPAVSSSKRHSTLPRGWKPTKNGESVPPTVPDTSRRASTLPVGADSSAMNGYSTLQRMKKGNDAIVQSRPRYR